MFKVLPASIFLYLLTTDWIFDISLLCENSVEEEEITRFYRKDKRPISLDLFLKASLIVSHVWSSHVAEYGSTG